MSAIYFDMDGTIADLYSRPDWLKLLRAENPAPYSEAAPLVNMSLLARYINRAQAKGHKVGIISWLSKAPSPHYDAKVTVAKHNWLQKHLPSVSFDEIIIVPYGTPKSETVANADILFDDEERNRLEWGEGAHTPEEIFSVLKTLCS